LFSGRDFNGSEDAAVKSGSNVTKLGNFMPPGKKKLEYTWRLKSSKALRSGRQGLLAESGEEQVGLLHVQTSA
jgi:hypothetical protein